VGAVTHASVRLVRVQRDARRTAATLSVEVSMLDKQCNCLTFLIHNLIELYGFNVVAFVTARVW
jgi:hypothetical protein